MFFRFTSIISPRSRPYGSKSLGRKARPLFGSPGSPTNAHRTDIRPEASGDRLRALHGGSVEAGKHQLPGLAFGLTKRCAVEEELRRAPAADGGHHLRQDVVETSPTGC